MNAVCMKLGVVTKVLNSPIFYVWFIRYLYNYYHGVRCMRACVRECVRVCVCVCVCVHSKAFSRAKECSIAGMPEQIQTPRERCVNCT